MKKMHSKCTAFLILVLVALPTSAQAFTLPTLPSLPLFTKQSPSDPAAESAAAVLFEGGVGICTRTSLIHSSVINRIASADQNYSKRLLESMKTSVGKDATDTKEARRASDAKFKTYIASLEKKAGSNAAKKAAVKAFSARVEAASTARRAEVDAARSVYVDSVAALQRGRISAVVKLSGEMKRELVAAVISASVRCRDGVDPRMVREGLLAELPSIEATYKAKLSDTKEFSAALSALASLRQERILQADTVFTAALDAASKELRAVVQ